MVISRDEIEYKDFLENCKILNEQGIKPPQLYHLLNKHFELPNILPGNK